MASATTATISLRTVSSPNMREHWAVRARRVKAERNAARFSLPGQLGGRFAMPCTVTLTRVTPPRGKTLDDDNLRGCLKAVRDGVADWLGVADNDPRVTWRYDQRKGEAWQVVVEVTA